VRLLHVVSFALLTVLLSCRRDTSPGIKINAALDSFVPQDATVLAGIDVDKIKAAPLYRKHQDLLDLPALKDSSQRLGLDLKRDLSAALIVWQENEPVTIATGRFSSSAVQPHLLSLGAQKADYKKQSVLTFGQGSLFFPRSDLVVAGPTPALHTLIDRGRGGTPEALKARLALLSSADQAWMVSTGGLPLGQVPLSGNAASALSNLVRFVAAVSLGIGVDSGAHLQADLTCISPDGAKQVHDALRGGIGLARLTTRDDQLDLLHLYDAIHVDQENEAVHVRADLNSELVDKLLTYLPAAGQTKPPR
jgi:hypothetical protein